MKVKTGIQPYQRQIKEAMDDQGWNDSSLARATGIHRQTISDILNGTNSSYDSVKKIAKKLGFGDDNPLSLD